MTKRQELFIEKDRLEVNENIRSLSKEIKEVARKTHILARQCSECGDLDMSTYGNLSANTRSAGEFLHKTHAEILNIAIRVEALHIEGSKKPI